ncbi:hypothetical protein KI809_01160 [Geobacter pelophilus]|uniref:Lipoprotein n=1 Tax=Geoanaerobacter pelophilus TaxID=60036 RepID=A0AAW4L049_9BACT|nr:hypothetical protein [Geoanaerobacter pelophilus]MBT0662892.1 hypothetical protein [Geoanaerobacter pelophilus]
MKKELRAACVMFALAGLAGCGGGGSGGGGSATALTVAGSVSVVDAKADSTVTGKVMPLALPGVIPTTAAYYTDKTNVYVDERAADALGTVNEILCMVSQTKYDAMLNKGPYKALVDKKLCSSSKGDAANSGASSQQQGTSAGEVPDYQTFILDVTRADNNSPQIAQVWVEQSEQGQKQMIHAKFTVSKSADTTNPYGEFTMSFIGYPIVAGVEDTANPFMKGTIGAQTNTATGKVELSFYEEGNYGFGAESRVAKLNKTDGSGSVKSTNANDAFEFDFAFNDNFFMRKNKSNNAEFCMDRTNFERSVWRYGLYDVASGDRIDRKGGFPVKYSAGGTDYFGFVGYWGINFSENVNPADGAQIFKQEYGPTTTETAYTLFKKDGKLKKHIKKGTTLGMIKGIPLDSFEGGTNKRYEWNGSNFVLKQQMNCSNNQCFWEDTASSNLNTSSLQFNELNFWSESLGGQVRVKLSCTMSGDGPGVPPTQNCTAPNDANNVVYYVENVVMPGETIPASLACFQNCPNPATVTTSNPFFAMGNMFVASAPSQNVITDNAKSYTFDSTNMVLKSSGAPVVATTLDASNQWGVNSGPLFDPTDATNLDALACNMPNGMGGTTAATCGWQTGNLAVYYTWETGSNNWNKLTALKKSDGTFEAFEQPLRVTYDKSQTGAGPNYSLDYSGFGQLNGIPGKCVNANTGADVTCTNSRDVRWVPQFYIKLGDKVVNGTTEYLVKPLDVSQRMIGVALTNCTGAGLAYTSYTLPASIVAAGWVDPALGLRNATTTRQNAVKAAPAVIGGVLQ